MTRLAPGERRKSRQSAHDMVRVDMERQVQFRADIVAEWKRGAGHVYRAEILKLWRAALRAVKAQAPGRGKR